MSSKKQRKEKDMKRIAMIAIAAALAVVMAFSFVACGGGAINLSSTVANGAPDLKPTKEINANMSAIEMLTAAVDNYYGADFALARTTGSLTTEVMSMKLTQFVKSITIRDGASDADNKLYYQNQSGTVKDGGILGNAINIRIWEETDYVKSGDSVNMYFRSANSDALTAQKLTNAEGVITDTWFEWNGGAADFTATKSYNSLDTYIEERASDPTRIWMYDINANTILSDKTVAPKSTTEKLSDGSEIEYYTFSVSGNVDKNSPGYSVEEYEEQMLYMLNSQGQNPSEFYFTEITLEVQVWPNGFFRQVKVTESYYMKLMLGVDSVVTLTSTKSFFFDENDLPGKNVDRGAFDPAQIGTVQATA